MKPTMIDKLAEETARREVARKPWQERYAGPALYLKEQEDTAQANPFARVFELRADMRVRYTVPPDVLMRRGIPDVARQNARRQMSAFLYDGMLTNVQDAIAAVTDGNTEQAIKLLLEMRAEILQ